MIKKSLIWLTKCIAAGCIALIIACLFSMVYYNTGRHTVNPGGATDYLWEGNEIYIQMREGIGFGITDGDGFNNAYPGVTSDADILLVGSSHMEAAQLPQDETAAYQLNLMLEQNGTGLTAYNIGVSAHNFYRCAANLRAALETYTPDYVVIETDAIPVLEGSAQMVLDGTLDEVASYEGLLYHIQEVPFPKLLMQQLREYQRGRGGSSSWHEFVGMLSSCGGRKTNNAVSAPVEYTTAFGPAGRQLLAQMSQTAGEYGAQLIIVFHPTLSLSSDGTAQVAADSRVRAEFAQLCGENGITLVDLGDVFLQYYSSEHLLPHGFINSETGYGHLNAHGHRVMAEELCDIITELQGGQA